MYNLAFCAVSALLLLFIGYLVSVFSNAVYIDPDEIQSLFPELSERRRRQLKKLTANPRAFIQIAFLVRISAAIFLGCCALLIAGTISRAQILPPIIVYIVVIAVFWSAALIFFIYLPRRMSPRRAKLRLVRFLPLINFIYLLSAPFTLYLGRIASRRSPADVTEDQKDDIVERAIESLAESAGISTPIIEEDEKEMIHQIFQLDVTEVEEIMIPRINVIGIESTASLNDIRNLIKKHGFSRFPIFEENIDNVIGILYVKDLLTLTTEQLSDFNIRTHIREPLRVGERRKIDQLMADFKRTHTHMAIVLDEFGGTAGVVTLEDILEEIVGEIEDEHDIDKDRDVTRRDDGTLEVSGAFPLEDLAEELGIEIRQEEFETVGGMIYDMVGSVPSEGTYLSWENCKIKVLEVEGQRIKKVLVIPGATSPPQ